MNFYVSLSKLSAYFLLKYTIDNLYGGKEYEPISIFNFSSINHDLFYFIIIFFYNIEILL